MLWIPPGFAHGFAALEDGTELIYKVTRYWSSQHERTIRWNDPEIGIEWPRCGPPRYSRPRTAPAACCGMRRCSTREDAAYGCPRPAWLRVEANPCAARPGDRVRPNRAPARRPGVSIRHVVRDTAPALIVNAGAYTAVDQAESEPDLAMAINGIAPGILAEEAKRIGAATVHYSTDYVFDGEKNGPYVEDDPAQSAQCLRMHQARRRAGRDRCRRALPHIQDQLDLWLARPQFHAHDPAPRAAGWAAKGGAGPDRRPNLVAAGRGGNRFVLARTGGDFGDLSGLYHLSCAGTTSWYGFASAIVQHLVAHAASSVVEVTPIDSAD